MTTRTQNIKTEVQELGGVRSCRLKIHHRTIRVKTSDKLNQIGKGRCVPWRNLVYKSAPLGLGAL